MRVIAVKTLREFWKKHADAEQSLKAWYDEAEQAQWKNINEIKAEYPSAGILQDSRICFNIKRNDYRLIVKINFKYKIIYIRFIGTHAQYDKINANTI
ncbi:MAG: type II toxin-antitoxin system HigB family toxin [Bacteroidetes bacterium]|nr:type II toxin-antitoxin system HigB family toxin [Bacteroidota bacterium]